MSEQLIVIKTHAEFMAMWTDGLDGAEYVAFDTETTGVDKKSLIIGFSVAANDNTGYYVVLRYWDVARQELIEIPETLALCESFMRFLSSKQLVMHNAIFDCSMVSNNFKVDLLPALHTDTMILGHILDENRSNGLKELGTSIFGETAKDEQKAMKESVGKNGGKLTKKEYQLYKADAELIARYGAKDAILTMKLFFVFVPQLFEQGLDKFFYEDESMPLLKSATNDLNTTGLKIDAERLLQLRMDLEAENLELKSFIHREIHPHVKDKYPGDKPKKTFNIGSSTQIAWLLFHVLDNEFNVLTDEGAHICEFLDIRRPYTPADKYKFIIACREAKDMIYVPGSVDPKTGKTKRAKKIKDYWIYLASGKENLSKYAKRYKWVESLLKYYKNQKILTTYVIGIQDRMKYNIINPTFYQHGTTSGRYSSKNPNFQNLPRDDKRVKSCVVSRPGKVFVGADYSQLEPRVFASFSGDQRLLDCFKSGQDFYSVIGMEVFEKYDCSPVKDEKDSFAKKYPELRQISKAIALAATYGTTANRMAHIIQKSREEAQYVINSYFDKFPSVYKMMLDSHLMAKKDGQVVNLFGRPRRIPLAKEIRRIFSNTPHEELDYIYRNVLNLAVNHRIQSTGASIMNRAAIAFLAKCKANNVPVKLVSQIHDELIAECLEEDSGIVVSLLKDAMENTIVLPGVDLIAEPKIAKNFADLK